MCRLPPMPRGFTLAQRGALYMSISPDPYTLAFSRPRRLSLFTPLATGVTVARSEEKGGVEVTVLGQAFPPGDLRRTLPVAL